MSIDRSTPHVADEPREEAEFGRRGESAVAVRVVAYRAEGVGRATSLYPR